MTWHELCIWWVQFHLVMCVGLWMLTSFVQKKRCIFKVTNQIISEVGYNSCWKSTTISKVLFYQWLHLFRPLSKSIVHRNWLVVQRRRRLTWKELGGEVDKKSIYWIRVFIGLYLWWRGAMWWWSFHLVPPLWGIFMRYYCELWVHFLWTSWNISYFSCCWCRISRRGKAIPLWTCSKCKDD